MRSLIRTLVAFVVLLPACDPVLGLEDLPRATPCATCSTRGCGKELAACQGDATCNSLLTCLDACADGACRDTCQTRLAEAGRARLFGELDACRRGACAAECFGPSTLGGACQCLDDSCRAEALACAGEADCDRFVACGYSGGLTDPERINFCATQWSTSSGPTRLGPLYQCWQKHTCAGCESATGQADGCAGRYHWGKENGKTFDIGFSVRSLTSRAGLEKITVRACDPFDAVCTTAVDEQPTASLGRLRLHLPQQFEGYLKASAPGFAPGLFQFGRPIARPEAFDFGTFFLYPSDSLDGAFATAGVTKLADRGHALVVVHDCTFDSFVGARLDAVGDATTRTFYLQGPLLDPTRTETASDGTVFLANVPVGQQVVRARRGDKLVAQHTLEVRAGTVSWLDLYPTPAP